GCRLHGLPTMTGRVPTFAYTVDGIGPAEAAAQLAERGFAVWAGDYYAVEVMRRLGLAEGAVRVGIVHYNTAAEVDGLLAALAEHMFFKGTENRPTARDIAGEVDAMGGQLNAFTSKEYTGYYVRCAGEHRDTALDVLVDMIRRSKFDAEEIDREKGVIIEEMNMYFDTPRDYIGGVYDELLYGDQPLGWDIIGRKETVRGATRDTFMGYLGHWYKPSRMV